MDRHYVEHAQSRSQRIVQNISTCVRHHKQIIFLKHNKNRFYRLYLEERKRTKSVKNLNLIKFTSNIQLLAFLAFLYAGT